MNITINAVNFNVDKKLEDFTEKKVQKLFTLNEDIQSVSVSLKLEKDEAKENKVAEIKVKIPYASDSFASKQCKTFEEAVDQSVDALKKNVVKAKEKIRAK